MIRLGIQMPPAVARISDPPNPPAAGSEAARIPAEARLQQAMGERFEVLSPIALGGMATIYQLRHRQHGGLFVAKVLKEDLSARPEVVNSFRREARHAAQLGDHPNAIPVFDAGESDGLHFLLMPFIEGEDLDELLREHGPLDRAETLHLAAQIASLLCHAESHGITHCDLAPGNIRLDTFGRYRLMDFGISRAADSPAAAANLAGGTPLYSSPEQIRGEVPDTRADLYALGLVLCETLSGKPLMNASNLADLREQHLTGRWKLPKAAAADPVLSRLLEKLLAVDRERRFGNAFELSGALAALGFDRPEFRVTSRPADSREPAAARRTRLS